MLHMLNTGPNHILEDLNLIEGKSALNTDIQLGHSGVRRLLKIKIKLDGLRQQT